MKKKTKKNEISIEATADKDIKKGDRVTITINNIGQYIVTNEINRGKYFLKK